MFSSGSEKINSTSVLGSFAPIEQEEGCNIILWRRDPENTSLIPIGQGKDFVKKGMDSSEGLGPCFGCQIYQSVFPLLAPLH